MDDTLPTYLSDNVYEAIINLRLSDYACNNEVVDENLILDWNAIDNELNNISESSDILDNSWEWYRDKVTILWGIMLSVDKHFKKSSESVRKRIFELSSWVFNFPEVEDIYNKFMTCCDSELLFCVLKLTSYLDRALGDVYKTTCEHVPFLLKDMLASSVLIEAFGIVSMKFLQLLLGTVRGLNLRNVAWHGFFSPGELHQSIISTMFLTIASLGISIKSFERRPTIKHETLKSYSQCLKQYFEGIDFDKTKFMNTLHICPFISTNHWAYWNYASDLYIQGCYGDCLILLMPLTEAFLRSIFCFANDCSERVLTAESTAFYITMDDVLAPTVGSQENRLKHAVGPKILEMLLDLYIYEEGPRLRDRISHSEVKPYDVPEDIARCVFDISILLMLISINVKKALIEQKGLTNSGYSTELIDLSVKYKPQFHPISIFKRSFVNIIINTKSWNGLPRPSDLDCVSNFHANNEAVNFLKVITGYVDFVNYSNDIIKRINDLEPETIYRPKHEMELISILRRIVCSIEELNANISESCQSKLLLWKNKQMKSRNRESYKRMLQCIPNLQYGIGCLFYAMFITLQQLQKYESDVIKKTQRFLKLCQKYAENASTMSSIRKNRWKELEEGTFNICNVILSEPSIKN
ncbi:endoplasmic reticulum membrane-associated RNA degradation protein [Halyomorpha halys]|uniref:endoplasmic reticulum membrane-associated RNA degradation protein n=1 Tax=Halyomorpha halys TaxID=286706 RepID=UPI0006D4ECC9|nr:endoplasmic reticulum membrane-associated RNA degradation protein-like [Halyomorpha halys]XP_014289427.1 endoplasmic reticulum membrane-associated RNA degradation protein-like [Halyomorpha halys]